MPKHGQGVNSVDDDHFVSSVDELTTPLLIIKENLWQADLFSGCGEGFHLCMSLPDGCLLLKMGVQRLMDSKEILFEKTLVPVVPFEDISIITISANPSRITSAPRIAPLIITVPGPVPYVSNKAVP